MVVLPCVSGGVLEFQSSVTYRTRQCVTALRYLLRLTKDRGYRLARPVFTDRCINSAHETVVAGDLSLNTPDRRASRECSLKMESGRIFLILDWGLRD